jgi:hypothetical protein
MRAKRDGGRKQEMSMTSHSHIILYISDVNIGTITLDIDGTRFTRSSKVGRARGCLSKRQRPSFPTINHRDRQLEHYRSIYIGSILGNPESQRISAQIDSESAYLPISFLLAQLRADFDWGRGLIT